MQKLALPINVIGFQLCWIACVVGGNSWAIPVCAAFFVWHWQVLKNGEPMLLAAFAITGVLFDTALYKAGLLSFPGHDAWFIPLWLMLLWLAFACTLRHSLDWLLRKPWLAALLGLTAAPWSYYAGDLLGAVDAAPAALIMIGIGWAMLMFSIARLRPVTVKAEES